MNARPDFTPAITLPDSERQRCEIWTRVMGYHRPVASFNIGKQGEFHERRYFTQASAKLGLPACHGG
ncbi:MULTISPECIES: anaerobic ribonucleoside-triphosphate reductase [unclassified Janthinobacterium]|uniref:anaerobic ribonucleoside-triphosphate reductase n=1 Tax=unclassified Janthinobacterium TaxID=2610881 RepID=UPI00087FA70B|nr:MULTISPECIES: anaerobic ribonucleoside-triphosphate reductase [unclassified Janthinobacterium]SDA71804.1 Anaerobic ribonucleoside-triphosphate reductase [Janthinobacterium sp. 551a]SFB55125.1 Anaerobic ribonucleoside-triphosphate reductase [Janthinobacterium sp. 344]